jgi:hypothetical protein
MSLVTVTSGLVRGLAEDAESAGEDMRAPVGRWRGCAACLVSASIAFDNIPTPSLFAMTASG